MRVYGPDPPDTFTGNGCGPQTRLGVLARLIPDYDIGEACRRHDWHWRLAARGDVTYAAADRWLRQNIIEIRRAAGHGWLRSDGLAWRYWLGVRLGSWWREVRR